MTPAYRHQRDGVEIGARRLTDDGAPIDSNIVRAIQLDDYKIEELKNPVFCNPDYSADALFASYREILVTSMRPRQVASLNRVAFSKRGARHAFNNKSKIAVRLTYTPNRSKGLRVLSFSNDHDFRRRSQAGYETPLDHRLLHKSRSIARKFIEHSESLGLTVQFFSKHDGLVMSAQGSHTANAENCMVVVEIATGQDGVVLFRPASNHC